MIIKMKKAITFLLLVTLFLACSNENDNAALIGKWQGISWAVAGEQSGRNAAEVVFTFHPSDSYTAAFSQQKEEGSFRLVGNKLYTTAKGKAEKLVEVRFQGTDTLIMDMNRVGTLEELVLVKD